MIDETRIRSEAIQYALAARERWCAVPASEISQFEIENQRIFLKGQQGIFKPKELSLPLSITSTLDSPYADHVIGGTKILYDFAPPTREYENDGLKRCAEGELPLVYLLQVKRKPNPEYIVFAPAYVVDWDDVGRRFLIDLSEQQPAVSATHTGSPEQLLIPTVDEVRDFAKTYAVTSVERRLHQAKFRNEVLSAYRERCAVCVLRLRPLLDAAHVVPDRDPKPTVNVTEGLSLCATHHRAFDARLLLFDSAYKIRIELPEGFRAGEGEERILLPFDGSPLHLPNNRALWPVVA